MRTILVTGGTKGIGKAIALSLAKGSDKIVINYHADEDSAAEVLEECKKINENVLLIRADVSNESEVNAMIAEIVEKFGAPEIVINNAGMNLDKPLLEMTEAEWCRVVDVNMKSVFLVSKAAAKHMLVGKSNGHIINISATTGIAGRKNGINYCASKAGVIVMTKCLAKELGPKVRVNCVIPGITRTSEIEERFNLKVNEQFEVSRRQIPLSRIGEAFEVANIISFLISEEAAYINGQKIIIDGGEYM